MQAEGGTAWLRKLVRSEEFAPAHLLVALVCGWAWVAAPHDGAAPALLALPVLLFWLARLIARRPPFPRTRIDLLVWLFLLTAGVGVWASYNREAALSKFFVLLGAVFVFYAIVGHWRKGLLFPVLLLGVLAAGVALYFLLTQDWNAQPADIGLLNRLAQLWMRIRPDGLPGRLHQNVAGGLIAVFIPFQVWLLSYARARQDRALFWLGWGVLGISALGLLFSSSRAAWLALGCGLAAWLVYRLDQAITPGLSVRQRLALRSGAALLILLAAVLLAVAGGGAAALFNRLPGPNSALSRLEIDRHSLRLVQDFPFTGGGLSAFPGLFSEYQLVIPHLMFDYGHNLYLDLALEQGLLGLAAFLGMLAYSLVVALQPPGRSDPSGLRGALLAGLVVLGLHGLADDPLYGMRATPVAFALPALAAALDRRRNHHRAPDTPASGGPGQAGRLASLLPPAVVVVISIGMLFSWRAIAAAWQADLGALELARLDLADFPANQWRSPGEQPAAERAAARLEDALRLVPDQRTAHHRLGLIALQEMDYELARLHLEQALALDPDHRGVRKNLGYCYAWLGMYGEAVEVLRSIPEAQQEMLAYRDWWLEQGHEELSRRAAEMAGALTRP